MKGSVKAMTEHENLKCRIKELSFVLVELNLFLDSHPSCSEALAYFKEVKKEYDALVCRYEEMGMPLTVSGNTGDQWDWVMTPWPWESACH